MKNIKHLFVPHKIASKAKSKGFKEPCLAKFMLIVKGDTIPRLIENYKEEGFLFDHNSKDTSGLNGNAGKDFLWSAPLYQQILSFFLDKHDISVWACKDWNEGVLLGYCGLVEDGDGLIETDTFKTYNEAINEAINEALKLI